jgi:hypothetical protein
VVAGAAAVARGSGLIGPGCGITGVMAGDLCGDDVEADVE